MESLARVIVPKRFAAAALLFLASALLGLAADQPAAFECRYTDRPIVIDGVADEEAWKDAQVIENFHLPWLGKDDRPAKTATKARVLWDREYFYFFAEMEDTDLYALIKEHDGHVWEDDVFEIFFKPADNKSGYYEFEVNALGTVLDMFLPQRGAGGYERFRGDGEFHVEVKTKLDGTLNNWRDKDKGWSVEGRIPWRDFIRTGGRPNVGEVWKFLLGRYDYSVDIDGPELSTIAPLTHLDYHQWEHYASLKFVGPEKGKASRAFGIEERVPLTTSRVIGRPDPPPPFQAKRLFPKLVLNQPVQVIQQPGSDQLIVIAQIHEDGWAATTSVLRMRDDPNTDKFETLLESDWLAYSVEFHPDFAKNGFMYVGWKGPMSAASEKRSMHVTRYTMQTQPPYALDPASAKLILEWPSDGHDGGAMGFGKDGMMYITTGDGTSDSDGNLTGQDLTKFNAKLLRIDVDHPDAGKPYSVPKDNPFVDRPGVRPETWAYGFRNPWRMFVDRESGDIWVGNNGQDQWEQVYLARRGANYGWSVMEGSHPFYTNRQAGPDPIATPTAEHPHSESRSLTGGFVYRGVKFPELRGAYLYGDFATGKIWAIRHDGDKVTSPEEVASTGLAITSITSDTRGEILITDYRSQRKGGIFTLERTPKETAAKTPFPRKLSESGLFKSVKGHVMAPALIPYDVNAPLWSDGAFKDRWLAMPGDEKIGFTNNRGWSFPEHTVLVKSFALELEKGSPASRRWVETRFLTLQDGQWVGYSYAWNDEQTDATLVEAAGSDREYVIHSASGEHTQRWHYPSRVECMVCHSRAANFVLGLTTAQMNKEHDYAGVRDNQLRVWEHLGLFRVNESSESWNEISKEVKKLGLTEAVRDQRMQELAGSRDQRPAPENSPMLPRAPDKLPKLVNPYDPQQDLAARARSYLQGNCAHCHIVSGGGNSMMDLEFTTPLENANIVDAKPNHHTFNLPDARLVAPGHPERSVLLHRVSMRVEGHMPPLATTMVDREAVELLRAWIAQLPPSPPAANAKP